MATKKLSPKTKAALNQVVAKENRRVVRDNKAFEKLSPAEKRVAIARDVLAQISLKRLIPTNGRWLSGKDDNDLFSAKDEKKDLELQEILGKKRECKGCALGGMFMCAVELADKLKVSDLSSDTREENSMQQEDVFAYMKKFFTLDQLNKIESAFEQGDGATEDSDGAHWLSSEGDASERMRLIMENIIVNKGKFNLDKEPERAWVTPGFIG